MRHALYDELVPFYRLLDPTEGHEDEVASFVAAFERALRPSETRRSLLELGAGAGNNVFYARDRFDCTLVDLSEPMLSLSRALNPACEHVVGDLRTVRLGRAFDAVLVHDAICYMLTEEDLAAAARTAFAHLRAGGAALFVPDCVRESFFESTDDHAADAVDGTRGLRVIEWMWDPDPSDTTYTVDYAFLLKDASGVRAVHDRHIEGLFSIETWQRILSEAGCRVEIVGRPLGDLGDATPYTDSMFLAMK
jgi:SAM-dependent methyltransferase